MSTELSTGVRRAVRRHRERLAAQERAGLRKDILLCVIAGLGAFASLQVAWDPARSGQKLKNDPVVATVIWQLGGTRARSVDTLAWESLSREDEVRDRDTIYVPDNGELILNFVDGSTAHVEAGSLIVIESHERAGEKARSGLEVRRGGVLGRTVATSSLQVRTGKTAATLKGDSALVLRRDAQRGARVSVSGAGASLKTGAEIVELAGREEVAIAATGEVKERLRHTIDLISPGDGARVLSRGEGEAVTFVWKGGAEAARSELVIARDPQLRRIVSRQTTGTPRQAAVVPSGVFFWGVKQGASTSPVRRLVVIRDRPPKPVEPRSRSTVMVQAGETLRFRWLPSTATSTYRVRLLQGKNEGESAVVFDEQVHRPRYAYRGQLSEGDYRWDVRAVDAEVERAIPRLRPRFRIINRALPEAPQLLDSDFAPMVPIEAPQPPAPAQDAGEAEAEVEHGSFWRSLFISTAYAEKEPRPPKLLRWRTVPGISIFEIQLARDSKFKQVVESRKVEATYLRWIPPDDSPVFYFRVRSIDAEGREGLFSGALAVKMRLPAPRQLAPGGKATLIAGRAPIELTCLAPRDAEGLEVEIAAGSSFGTAVSSHRMKTKRGERLLWQPDAAGTYSWRARAVQAGLSPSEWSEPATFQVLPPAPVLGGPEDDEVLARPVPARVSLKWKPAPLATRYRLELARDEAFTTDRIERESETPGQEIGGLAAGRWYWRVRTSAGSGRNSEWSEVRDFRLRPPSLSLLAPPAGRRLEAGAVAFRWKKIAGARGYRLELRRQGVPGKAGRIRERVATNSAELELTRPGTYRWRVVAEDAEGRLVAVSSRRELRIEGPATQTEDPVGSPGPGREASAEIAIAPIPVRARRPARIVVGLASFGGEAETAVEIVGVSTAGTISTFERAGPGRRAGYLVVPDDSTVSEVTVTLTGNDQTLRRTVPVSREVDLVAIGPRLGAVWNFGRVGGVVPGLELLWRPSFQQRRLGLLFSLGYGWGTARIPAAAPVPRISSVLHRLPVDGVATWSFGSGRGLWRLRPILGAGLRTELVFTSLRLGEQVLSRGSGFLAGPQLVVGGSAGSALGGKGSFRGLLHLAYLSHAGDQVLVGGPWLGLSFAWQWRID